AACKIFAPVEGLIQYAFDPRTHTQTIRQGATVRPRQVLLHFLDADSPLQVEVKIPEARITHITTGRRARVFVDAFPNAQFTGLVTDVSALPDPRGMSNTAQRVFTAKIRLDKGPEKVVPGMTAGVQTEVAEQEIVLTVP